MLEVQEIAEVDDTDEDVDVQEVQPENIAENGGEKPIHEMPMRG